MSGGHFAYCRTNGAVYRHWSNETVSKKSISEVYRRRLEIEQRIEDHLREKNRLTHERLRAINQARFEIARIAWHYDSILARGIIKQVRSLDPTFSPSGSAAPKRYRLVFQLLGFETAERLATLVRK
jgi:hypothetical protein